MYMSAKNGAIITKFAVNIAINMATWVENQVN
jgi:hypothetical protein